MTRTIRPNVRFRDVQHNQSGMASPSAMNGLAVAVALIAGLVGVGCSVLLTHLPDFWAGAVIGGLSMATLLIGLLAVGVCLGGARLSDVPRPGTCDRGAHR